MSSNKLYFGDNLDVLREYVPDESVDLVYLDPPFNSQLQYNVLFRTPDHDRASAQAGAFRDTWAWGEDAEWSFQELMRIGGGAARMLDALRSAIGETDMMAYLAMMAVRLHELSLKLKPTGSLYLHCDPTASHYLKVMLDSIFGHGNFKNEITWKRQSAHSDAKHKFSDVADTILFYAKSKKTVFTPQYRKHDPSYIEKFYRFDDQDGRGLYRLGDMASPNPRPNMMYEWRGFAWPEKGWRYQKETMQKLHDEGRIAYPQTKGKIDTSKRPALKRYLKEQSGSIVTSVWDDVNPLHSSHTERLGYPTQKPTELLSRIIAASSNEGDVVLDPFCGCGTTIEAAELAKRRWIGIDIAVHAIKVIEARLEDLAKRTGKRISFDIEGMPRDFDSAVRLAERDKYQFQWWANYLFNPHALREQKKGADRGIDGELFFPNGPGRAWGRMLTSVKGGDSIGPAMVRDFAHVLQREKAEMGLFICLRRPTRAMATEAAAVGFADAVHKGIPKLQIVAIEDWFEGRRPQLPPLEHLPSAAFSRTRARSQASKRPDPQEPELPLVFVGQKGIARHLNPRMVGSAVG